MSARDFIYAEIKDLADTNNISDDLKLKDDLYLDSLDRVDLFMRIEDKYNIEGKYNISEACIQEAETVGNLIDIIEAADPTPAIYTPKHTMLELCTIKNGMRFCKITEKKCDAMHPVMNIISPLKCDATKCKIAKNVDLLLKKQKIM